jgi:hypothetical protein
VGVTEPDKRPLQRGVDIGDGVLVDTAAVSRGILGPGEVDSESTSLVTTGKDEGMVGEGENECWSTGNATTDGRGCAVSRRGEGGTISRLFAQDLRDHRANSTELLPVLAGRLDGSPGSTRAPEGRLMIIVPERSPSCTKG